MATLPTPGNEQGPAAIVCCSPLITPPPARRGHDRSREPSETTMLMRLAQLMATITECQVQLLLAELRACEFVDLVGNMTLGHQGECCRHRSASLHPNIRIRQTPALGVRRHAPSKT